MNEDWYDEDSNFTSERLIMDRYHALLSAQFLQAAWFLRIVPDVYFKYVKFSQRCQELGVEVPSELEKYIQVEIGIEITSPKYGTLHIFGPADYEIKLEQIGKFSVTKPSIRYEGTHFDDVLGIVFKLNDIFMDKYFGEIAEMNRRGYVQNYHIDLFDARKLEALSLIFEAWYFVLQDMLESVTYDSFHNFTFVSPGSNNELFGKLYLPGNEDMYESCLIIHPDEPKVELIERSHENGVKQIFIEKLLRAAQNPNRP